MRWSKSRSPCWKSDSLSDLGDVKVTWNPRPAIKVALVKIR